MIDLGVVIEFMGKKRTTGNNLNLVPLALRNDAAFREINGKE